jgi:hypothetical protein
MAVPFTFGAATAAIPLSQLDTNFATAITLGNTAMYLGNTTTSVGNLTLTNVTISSGTANVTANITYGTANAVVYSNASNVGVTSANLTFNGTTLTSTGFAGPLNGTVGATTPAAGTFTSLSDSGNLTFTGTGNRITGDFSNATIANRVMFQTSTANSSTSISTIPSGSNTQADFFAFNAADPTNASILLLRAGTAETTIRSGITGSGTYLPLTTYTGGSERYRTDINGLTGFGTASATSLLQTAGTSSVSAFKTPNIAEVNTVSATAATGTINYDVTTQSVLYYTSNASANWTVNFRGSSGTSLNTLMQTNESISATFLVTQGATAYYNSAVTIDGSSVTPKWQGGTAPTSGNASSIDSYTYVIIKTGSAAFTVLAAQTKFA